MAERKSSQARIDANARYDKKAYDHVLFRVRKEADMNLDIIRTHAEAQGESINGFLIRAVTETIQRDNESGN